VRIADRFAVLRDQRVRVRRRGRDSLHEIHPIERGGRRQ
jgi:hypothetical protein